jgi:hypothetical protein
MESKLTILKLYQSCNLISIFKILLQTVIKSNRIILIDSIMNSRIETSVWWFWWIIKK